MRKTFSLFALGIAVTISTSFATYGVMTNEDSAAIAEVFICVLVALMTLTNFALPLGSRLGRQQASMQPLLP